MFNIKTDKVDSSVEVLLQKFHDIVELSLVSIRLQNGDISNYHLMDTNIYCFQTLLLYSFIRY